MLYPPAFEAPDTPFILSRYGQHQQSFAPGGLQVKNIHSIVGKIGEVFFFHACLGAKLSTSGIMHRKYVMILARNT
jgi:hypothetical protein